MKHKTLRTLLCVILTVCFCLSAIAPVSAAGLFSGDSGAASIFDEWIRSLKDRFIEKNPGTDETPAEPLAGAGEEFIRIFHLDCGRRYFTVDEIKGIIDTLEAKKYTHIELAFGNDGLRFLLDDMSVTANGKEYSNADVTAAIQAGNRAYYSNGQNELSEADMNTIIAYANEHHISVIPLINMPGHSNALITAMAQLFGVNRNSLYTYENSNGGQAFKVVDNEKAVAFATALAKKYVDYFSVKGSEYFNIGADECGYTESVSDNYPFEQTIASDLLIPMAEYIIGNGMKPMMFNDGFNTNDALQNALTANTYGSQFTICYWDYSNRTTADDLNKAGFGIINTHNKWYYVAGNEGENSDDSNWFGYGWAKNNLNGKYKNCSVCDSDFKQPNGCMLAYWCDKPTDAKAPNLDRVKELIGILSDNNTEMFTGNLSMPAKPAINGVPTSVQISDGTLNVYSSIAARWTSSNNSVITFEDAATKAAADSASYTETATARIVGAGTAIITATTANRGWSVQTVTVTNNGGTTTPSAKTITVTVGGTSTDTINGQYDGTQENEFAKVEAASQPISNFTKTTSYTNGGEFYISTNSNDSAPTIQITIESDGYGSYYLKNADGQYIYPSRTKSDKDYSYSLKYGRQAVGISVGLNGEFTISRENAYLSISDGSLTSESGNEKKSLYLYSKNPSGTNYETVVTVTGKKVTTDPVEMIVGTVKYLITVTAEDLSGVAPLPIQLWITNIPIQIDTSIYAGGSTSGSFRSNNNWSEEKAWYVYVSAADAYGESGVPLSNVLPASMTRYENNITYWINEQSEKTAKKLVLWSGRFHTSSYGNIQKIWDVDYSNSGTEFKYVRYFANKWEVSATGEKDTWVKVTGEGSTNSYNCSEQLAAYYMIRSTITNEVTTDVADWGYVKNDADYAKQISAGKYVMLDFAVKYQDGTRNPNTFPQDGKTFVFHCNTGDSSGAVQQDSSGNYYRRLNNFRAVNTSDYEVYMVTVTMTSDSASTIIADTTDYSYDTDEATGKKAGQEKLIWAIDAETRANSELTDYTAITSGDTTYSFDETRCIGGDPYVRGVEVYNEHGALITYYVRAKKLPDQTITVHYIDKKTGDEFYSYDIIVANGTTFNPGFTLGNNKILQNNTVKNSLGVTQTINAELKDMLSVPARYRRWKYECVEANTKEPYTNAYIYYNFDNTVAFVMDFGLPMKFTPLQVNANLAGATISDARWTSTKYGDLKYDNTTEEITYTLHDTLDAVEKFTLYYTGTIDGKEASTVEYEVSIIPATNVLYEENFMTVQGTAGDWKRTEASSTTQTTELAGQKQYVYGYDEKVAAKSTVDYSEGAAYTANLTLPDGKKTIYTNDKLTFSFTGTGFDLISDSGKNTGILVVRLDAKNAKTTKTYIIDTYFHGDDTVLNNSNTIYQTPVIRELSLGYDTYTVAIRGALYRSSGAVLQPELPKTNTYSMQASAFATNEAFDLRTFLDECGLADVSVEDVELIYMDENSVLNGGTGMSADILTPVVQDSNAVSTYAMDTTAVNEGAYTATVSVDGFRVYNPLENSSKVYISDMESGVSYKDLRQYVEDHQDSTVPAPANTKQVLYVEYNSELGVADIADYNTAAVGTNGPKYEIYLAPGCGIAFALDSQDSIDVLQLSAKVVSGTPSLKVGDEEFKVTATNGTRLNGTEMYFDISSCVKGINGKKYVTIINNAVTNYAAGNASVLAVNVLKMGSGIEPVAIDDETQNYILAEFAASMAEPVESFNPEVFDIYEPASARRNRSFSISANVSVADLEKVTITTQDGVETELNPLNKLSVRWGISSEYYYLKTFRMRNSGDYTFKITAYGKDGSSVSKNVTVTVK